MSAGTRAFAHWTLAELTAAVASDEGVLAKEGDRCTCVDRNELAELKAERTYRWANPAVRPTALPIWISERIAS